MNRYILLTSVKVIICFKMIFVNTNTNNQPCVSLLTLTSMLEVVNTNTNNQPCVSLLTLTSMLEVVNIHYKTIVIIVMSHFDFCTTILAANNSLRCATFENPYELNSKQRCMSLLIFFKEMVGEKATSVLDRMFYIAWLEIWTQCQKYMMHVT